MDFVVFISLFIHLYCDPVLRDFLSKDYLPFIYLISDINWNQKRNIL